jgi:hypothetical protein
MHYLLFVETGQFVEFEVKENSKDSKYERLYFGQEVQTIYLDPKWFETSDLEIKKNEIPKMNSDPKMPKKTSDPDLKVKERIMKEIKYCSQKVLKISDYCRKTYCKTN